MARQCRTNKLTRKQASKEACNQIQSKQSKAKHSKPKQNNTEQLFILTLAQHTNQFPNDLLESTNSPERGK
jgi:hypothetical protein